MNQRTYCHRVPYRRPCTTRTSTRAATTSSSTPRALSCTGEGRRERGARRSRATRPVHVIQRGQLCARVHVYHMGCCCKHACIRHHICGGAWGFEGRGVLPCTSPVAAARPLLPLPPPPCPIQGSGHWSAVCVVWRVQWRVHPSLPRNLPPPARRAHGESKGRQMFMDDYWALKNTSDFRWEFRQGWSGTGCSWMTTGALRKHLPPSVEGTNWQRNRPDDEMAAPVACDCP